MDDARPYASSVAVRAGRVLAVGSDDELSAYRGAGTQVVDVGGRGVSPRLIDAHSHLSAFGHMEWMFVILRPPDVTDFASLATVLRQAARSKPEGEWIVGRGLLPRHLFRPRAGDLGKRAAEVRSLVGGEVPQRGRHLRSRQFRPAAASAPMRYAGAAGQPGPASAGVSVRGEPGAGEKPGGPDAPLSGAAGADAGRQAGGGRLRLDVRCAAGAPALGPADAPQAIFEEIIAAIHRADLRADVHAVGDKGVDWTLQTFAHAAGRAPAARERRHRIEHFPFRKLDSIRRAAEMNVPVCVQPAIVDFRVDGFRKRDFRTMQKHPATINPLRPHAGQRLRCV